MADGVGRIIADKDTPANTLGVDASKRVAIQNPPNLDVASSTLATEATAATLLTQSEFQARVPTVGQKAMVAALPVSVASDQSDLDVVPKDTAGNPMEVEHAVAVPANTKGILLHGKTLAGVAAVPSVILDGDDSKWRVAIEGKVSIEPPTPPVTATQIVTYADVPAIVPGNQDRDTVIIITDTKRFFIQQIILGAEGDPTESGSQVALIYSEDGGTTEHLVQKFFVQGQSYTITFPNVDAARDGTFIDGVAVGQGQLIIRRSRQGGGNQEVDATLIGYEDTP